MKVLCVLCTVLLLCGCQMRRDYETMADTYIQPDAPAMGEVTLLLPTGAEAVTVENGQNGKMWMCEDYWVCLETSQSGNLEETLRTLTGHSKEQLSPICLDNGQQKRYECVWMSVGENGDQINRAVILDDGNYHYALTLHTAAEAAGELTEQWKNITTTFAVNIGP